MLDLWLLLTVVFFKVSILSGVMVMKKMKIKVIFFIVFLSFLANGSGWAATYDFTDSQGQWWSASNFSLTIDWSDGWSITAVDGNGICEGVGDVHVSLGTDSFVKYYSLDAGAISNGGPEIEVTSINIPFLNTGVVSLGAGNLYAAWDGGTKTVMLYEGDDAGNCYECNFKCICFN